MTQRTAYVVAAAATVTLAIVAAAWTMMRPYPVSRTPSDYVAAFKALVQSEEPYAAAVDWSVDPWPVHVAASNSRTALVCGRVRSGPDAGQEYAVQYPRNQLGRADANEISTPAHGGTDVLPVCGLGVSD